MENILLFILGYLVLIIFWIVLVLLFYFLSFISKKNLVSIPVGFTYILSIAIQFMLIGYALYTLWQIVSNREWWLLILAFVFGSFIIGMWQAIYDLLLAPFKASAIYFLEKVEKTDFGENTVVGEVLDKDNKVINISEGETSLKTRFAKYFLLFYAFNLIYILIYPAERAGLAPFDFVIKPFFQIISSTILIGFPYGIYRKIKYKSFFTKDKRYFLIQVWKISLYIFIPLAIILFIVALATNTI